MSGPCFQHGPRAAHSTACPSTRKPGKKYRETRYAHPHNLSVYPYSGAGTALPLVVLRSRAPYPYSAFTWNGTPKERGDLFVLHKNRRDARALIVTHQLGWRIGMNCS